MVEEESFDSAIEDDDLHLFVRLDSRHDLPEFQNEFWTQ